MCELAWAAGFFDGEGCSTISRSKDPVKSHNSKRGYLNMAVSQSSEDGIPEVLERFRQAVGGLGAIYGPYYSMQPNGRPRKPVYRWQTYRYDALAVFSLLSPYLGSVKRQQMSAVLIALEELTEKKKKEKVINDTSK